MTRPLDPSSVSSSTVLPAPLIPLPEGSPALQAEEEQGREAPIQPQELDSNLGSGIGEPEVGVEAYGEIESGTLPASPAKEVVEMRTESPENNGTEEPPPARGKERNLHL